MDTEIISLLNAVNQSIILIRGLIPSGVKGMASAIMSFWCCNNGECTQSMICDNYLLSKQTVNNVVVAMQKECLLTLERSASSGREKRIVLTDR